MAEHPLAGRVALPSHAPEPSGRLAGATAIVFGAGSSGDILSNGQAAALAYALAGAAVVAVDLYRERAEATARLVGAAGGLALAVEAQAGDEREVETVFTLAIEAFGKIDILHNNAGIADVAAIEAMPTEAWDRAFAVNARAPFLASRLALRQMLMQPEGGVITNISTVGSIRYPGIAYAGYAASKAALNQFTVQLALENAARNIRANAIVPGLLHTSLVQNQLAKRYGRDGQAAARERAALCPMGFTGDAWDVANASVFLASREARYITGQLLIVDGGLSARCA
jgi:NAD(P)-dependent dehydrogenase (short-subunit alcohol dehydrogenase family)